MRSVRVGNMDMGEGSREIKRKGERGDKSREIKRKEEERGDKREANHCTVAKWSTL